MAGAQALTFLILIMATESIGVRMEWLWMQGFNVIRDITGAPHG